MFRILEFLSWSKLKFFVCQYIFIESCLRIDFFVECCPVRFTRTYAFLWTLSAPSPRFIFYNNLPSFILLLSTNDVVTRALSLSFRPKLSFSLSLCLSISHTHTHSLTLNLSQFSSFSRTSSLSPA